MGGCLTDLFPKKKKPMISKATYLSDLHFILSHITMPDISDGINSNIDQHHLS